MKRPRFDDEHDADARDEELDPEVTSAEDSAADEGFVIGEEEDEEELAGEGDDEEAAA